MREYERPWREAADLLATDTEREPTNAADLAEIKLERKGWVGAAEPQGVLDLSSPDESNMVVFQKTPLVGSVADTVVCGNLVAVTRGEIGFIAGHIKGRGLLPRTVSTLLGEAVDQLVERVESSTATTVDEIASILEDEWAVEKIEIDRRLPNYGIPLRQANAGYIPGAEILSVLPDRAPAEIDWHSTSSFVAIAHGEIATVHLEWGGDWVFPNFTASAAWDYAETALFRSSSNAVEDRPWELIYAIRFASYRRTNGQGPVHVMSYRPILPRPITGTLAKVAERDTILGEMTVSAHAMELHFQAREDFLYDTVAKAMGYVQRKARFINITGTQRELRWFREPGTLMLEVFNASGDQACMKPIEVLAGRKYTIEYSFHNGKASFRVEESG